MCRENQEVGHAQGDQGGQSDHGSALYLVLLDILIEGSPPVRVEESEEARDLDPQGHFLLVAEEGGEVVFVSFGQVGMHDQLF